MTQGDNDRLDQLPHSLGGRARVVTGPPVEMMAGRRTLAEMLELMRRIDVEAQTAKSIRSRGPRPHRRRRDGLTLRPAAPPSA